jgi:hypothetical protein
MTVCCLRSRHNSSSMAPSLATLRFSISLIKLIGFILSQRKSFGRRWNGYAKGYTSRCATRFCPVPPQCTVYMYINNTPQTPGVHLGLCWLHLYEYICDRQQRGFCSQKAAARSQCCWDVAWVPEHKISEDETRAIYFSHRLSHREAHLTLNGRNITFVSHVKYRCNLR